MYLEIDVIRMSRINFGNVKFVRWRVLVGLFLNYVIFVGENNWWEVKKSFKMLEM